jgi:hypothetical protein
MLANEALAGDPQDPPVTPTPPLATDGIAPVVAAADQVAQPDTTAPDPEAGRILGILPDNKIVSSTKAATEEPLTTRAKYVLAFRDTTDPSTFLLAGFYAGIAQWQNDYPSWKLGAAGYGRRLGAAYADQAVGNYLTEAILPALLREDPRYFRKGTGGGWSRTAYALTRVLITRTDRGRNDFNYSEFIGNGAAAGISNLYYPHSEATLGETGEKFAVQVVSDAAFNIILEFWPDMRRVVARHTPFFHDHQ